jgi:putative PIN family toxin of toxin-antitoxin system
MFSAVLDSTALVSAFLRKEGVSATLLRHAAGGVFALSLSHEILTETNTVLLEREHIRRRYPYTDEDVTALCQALSASFPLVTDLPQVTVVLRDPQDDMVIATALHAHMAYIVTRDDDLLSLGSYEGMTMITPEAFMGLLREHGRLPP